MMPETTCGETNARGTSRRTCRSTLCSRRAISAKDAILPSTRSLIHCRAYAIASSDASRVSGFSEARCVGAWRTPFTAARPGAVLALDSSRRASSTSGLRLIDKAPELSACDVLANPQPAFEGVDLYPI